MIYIYFHQFFKIVSCGIIMFPILCLASIPLSPEEAHPINIDSMGGFGQRNVPIHRNIEQKLAPVRRHARFELFDVESDTSNGKHLRNLSQQSRANQLGDNRSSQLDIVAIQNIRNDDQSAIHELKPKTQYFKSTKQRNFMPIDERAAKQFQRVMKAAEKLNIIEQKERVNVPLVIASPGGNPDQGSISQFMRNPQNNGINGYKLRRGPYEDAYHTQIMDDYEAVSSMLGHSVNGRHEPNMNEILSQIMLRENWDIFRL